MSERVSELEAELVRRQLLVRRAWFDRFPPSAEIDFCSLACSFEEDVEALIDVMEVQKNRDVLDVLGRYKAELRRHGECLDELL